MYKLLNKYMLFVYYSLRAEEIFALLCNSPLVYAYSLKINNAARTFKRGRHVFILLCQKNRISYSIFFIFFELGETCAKQVENISCALLGTVVAVLSLGVKAQGLQLFGVG